MSSISQLAAANADSKPYWEAAQAGRLVFKKCLACAHLQFPPRHLCPKCWSDQAEWITSAGSGRVHSFSIVHRAPTPAYAAKAPYVIAMIDLAEGPRMLTNIVGGDALEIQIGDEVSAVFEPEADGSVLPQFRRVV
jgi:uncharacterized protein